MATVLPPILPAGLPPREALADERALAATQAVDSDALLRFNAQNSPCADDEVKILCEPGKLGMTIDSETGKILSVDPMAEVDGVWTIPQALRKGIKPGWVIRAIDGRPFSDPKVYDTWKYRMKLARLDDPNSGYTMLCAVHNNKVPKVLYINAPHCSHGCAGIYDLVPRKRDGRVVPGSRPNDMPMWTKRDSVDGQRYLYSSFSGGWVVGDEEAKLKGFKCALGFLATVAGHEQRIMPHEMEHWKRVDPALKCGEWVMDTSIALSNTPAKGGKRKHV
eukprot:TRINITY_DN42064_c0_g1_i1.p1 TRINITY_DN42064_c0_g1~~TRINITY_DN42064_c0_g1_i1.p1  ORF type:complete len:297 (+),score=68.86 TRINITY_DN42064_c0_g1_i1:61-891(+)